MDDTAADRPLVVVVLAAGEGTRMRSATTAKVLHSFAGRSMLGHALAACDPLAAGHTVVVVGHRREAVIEHLAGIAPSALAVVQDEQNGTGHAVQVALAELAPTRGDVIVLPGDAPLLRPETLLGALTEHRATGAAATLLTSELADPSGYGRVIRDAGGAVARIVEHRDATPDELAVREINAGMYIFDEAALRDAVHRLDTDNSQGELYLTDVIEILERDGRRVGAILADATETAGVNDRVQLAAAHRACNDRLLDAHMRDGVTIIDPATTWVDVTVTIEPDATLRPGVELFGRTHIAEGAVIGPQTTLTDTSVGPRSRLDRTVAFSSIVGADVTIGPFAYLRPGSDVRDAAHVGTYVEIKNSEIGSGSKVPHLTYVGDATIGTGSNIGASSVFVNYDGMAKHRSVIGDHVRIGSDTMIVAPVTVGDGAYTAAGSVIIQDVPPGAMAIARARQRNVADWVVRKRAGTPSADAAERASQDTESDHREGTE